MPTDNPTRWPAPSSASENAMSYPLPAVAPTLKKPETAPAAMRVELKMARPADATDP